MGDLTKFLKAKTNDFLFEVASGNIPGAYIINKFFENPASGTSLEEVWDFGPSAASYTYTADSGADYYLTSSNAGDTQFVKVYILDENKDQFYVIRVQLNGTTPVKINELTHTFITPWDKPATGFKCTRIFRISNDDNADFAGNIYCVEGVDTYTTPGVPDTASLVRAYVSNGNNTTLMCQFPIPKNYHGFMFHIRHNILRKSADARGDITPWFRADGKVFKKYESVHLSTLATSSIENKFTIPLKLEPGTDITIKCLTNADSKVSGNYQVLLLKNEFVDNISDHVHT